MPNPPDKFEHYELLKNPDGSFVELGRGAMGVTYKAFDTNLHCEVALKMIGAALLNDPAASERFLREARAAAQLRHRNVASVFHLGRCGGSSFYAMEFIDGPTVDELVRRDGPFSPARALDFASQVACALIAADQEGLVHRDIKPANLMLVREGDGELLVKVIDFGLVKSEVVKAGGELTSSGFIGTPFFASPEQLEGRDEDIRSDIYSLGITLWFMLTGRPPFSGAVASVIAQHLEKPPPLDALAKLPPEVVSLLRRMLEKDVDRRIQTAVELRAEIRRCLARLRGEDEETAEIEPETRLATPVAAQSSAGEVRVRPTVGTLLGERYRLIEDLNPGNPNRTFHAEDIVQKRRVRVKVVEENAALFAWLEAEVAKVKMAAHRSFIEVLTARHAAGRDEPACVVLEWIDGFSLLDVLRARRELTPREVLVLLEHLAVAIDAARGLGLQPELGLRDIFIDFSDGFDEPAGEVMLRCPLAEWPAFGVKLNPLGRLAEFERHSPSLAGQTMVPLPRHGDEVAHLGGIAYELLGGKPGGIAPLANLAEPGNDVLRRGMNPAMTFASAAEFVRAFAAAAVHNMSRPPLPVPPTLTSRVAPSSPTAAPEKPRRSHRLWQRAPAILVALAIAILAGLPVGWWLRRTSAPPPPDFLGAKPSAPVTPIVPIRLPPKPDEVWTNSLGVTYAPLGGVHFAMMETRVRDFEAFMAATGYDAVGGMSSLQRDGFRQHGHTWKNPGFQQTRDHPVVGVSWEDANQFCAWLTRKERVEGALNASQFYRLPTDREWSVAVGLKNESGATPEERSGRIKGIYPWGRAFPPPPETANYAGSEALPETPEGWVTIPGYRDAYPRTCPAISFTPNEAGLAELGGNVWEWCMDAYNQTSPWRVLRGGSWATSSAEEMLSSYRRGFDPRFRYDDAGFRCVIAGDAR